jgi:hypothetical protein
MLTLDQKYSPNTLLTDLESSLEHYFKPETLIVNCEGCSTCTTSDGGDSGGSSVMPSFDSSPEISLQDSIHKKTLSFASLPKYLCIQVTALWDPVSGNSFRNLRPWRYPDCLDLSKYCFLQQFQIEKTFNSKIYHLEAVIVHVGFDNCGHYYTLRKIDNAWYMVGFTCRADVYQFSVQRCVDPKSCNGPQSYWCLYSALYEINYQPSCFSMKNSSNENKFLIY